MDICCDSVYVLLQILLKFDELVKSQKNSVTVIPAKAGIQKYRLVTK